MPICLSVCLNINPKKLRLATLFLVSPLFFFAQSLTGLWTGILTNDSNSIRKDQSFEIALTEYRGKVYGYSRSEFVVNDTLYYIVKRVKGAIVDNICEVKDDEIISYNFPTRLDKGVKVISTFYRNKKDSTWYLAGNWKTNQTKKYYTITGKVDLKEEKDLTASKIFPHLQELNLANDVAFYKERKKESEFTIIKTVESDNKKLDDAIKEQQSTIKEPVVALNKPTIKTEDIKINESKKTESIVITNKPDAAITKAETKQNPEKQKAIIKTEPSIIKEPVVALNKPDAKTEDIKKEELKKTEAIAIMNKPDAGIKFETKQEPEKQKAIIKIEQQSSNKDQVSTLNKPDTKNIAVAKSPGSSVPVIQQNLENKKTDAIAGPAKNEEAVVSTKAIENKEIKKESAAIITSEIKKQGADKKDAATFITERKSEFSQVVNFKSDSLELALYDNGEIDGDTVSVLMNGEVILAKQGLKASAIKKTIYITRGKDDEFTMVLYAENLGKYPPNTGLLVVHDGDDVYNVRFSADFQTNAGIIFKRKQKQ
jgi:hypothetical protein